MKFRDSPKTGEVLAIEPKALDLLFDLAPDRENRIEDGIGIVSISGPLEHHKSAVWDSYDEIVQRIEEAITDEEVKAVVMCIDSPGGDAAGATEAHRTIKRLRQTHGKPIYAYSNESMYSAGYELGSAADEIWLPTTGGVGSIGVILILEDATKANEKAGLRVEMLTSGKRKADLRPDRVLTSEVLEAVQSRVDYLAEVFFKVVSASRGMSFEAVNALQAGCFYGKEAVKAGLADGVLGWDSFLSMVRSSLGTAAQGAVKTSIIRSSSRPNQESDAMATLLNLTRKRDEAFAALASAATEDERKKLAAKFETSILALSKAKADEEEEEDEDEKDKESEEEESEDPKDDEKEEEEEDDDDEKSSTGASSTGSTDAEEERAAALLTAKSGLHTHARLFRLCQQVTGQKGVKETFGALDAMGVRMKAAEKLESRLNRLEGENKRGKVDSMLKTAKREGRVTPAQYESLRAQGMKDIKWLKGYLATLPKQVRNSDEAILPHADAAGNVVGGLTSEQQKIMMAASQNLTPAERAAGIDPAKFAAKVHETHNRKASNGAGPRY